ncbi:hypothetical protein [Marivirga sp.]|uniref:hypothetical protein n=1 Tax=Marivirga sp. TaxID=2018662 RepID=UPI003DA6FE51
MTRFTSFLLLIFLVTACSDNRDKIYEVQNQFLLEEIEESNNKLKFRVEETGNSPVGKDLHKVCKKLTKTNIELTNKISKGEQIERKDIQDLIEIAGNTRDKIDIDSTFLFEGFSQYEQTNSIAFTNILLQFNLSTVNNIREHFNSFFPYVDLLNPRVISDKFEIKKGEIFRGTAISEAQMVAVSFKYEIDDSQTDEGFIEIPANASSNYNGIVKIKGLETGQHKIRVRTTQMVNGEEKSFEDYFILTVK